MAGRGDIKAGRAYVELMLKDGAFVKGLRNAGNQLRSFGKGMAGIGAVVTAAGSSIIGPIAGAVKHFADFGSELNDMAARTGISATALAELGYAAEQSGASMESVETSVKKMQKFLGAAAGGSKEAHQQLSELGLSFTELKSLKPEDQFQRIGEKLADMPADFRRTSAALAVFGKQGTTLLPMLETLGAMRQEARDLGLAPTEEAVKMADDLGDAFHRIVRAAGAVAFEIGASVAPAVLRGTKVITGIIVGANKWIRKNGDLVRTVAAVAAGVVVAGAVITGLGLTAYAAGIALTGLASIMSMVGGAITAIASPLGIMLSLLAIGAIAWLRFTESGQGTLRFLGELADIAGQTFQGIFDALSAGDLELAGRIALAGLKVGLLQGIASLAEAVGGQFGDLIGTIGTQLLSGDLSGAWSTALSGLSSLWAGFSEGMVSVFTGAMRAITDAWQATTSAISDWILKNASEGGWLGKIAIQGKGSVLGGIAGALAGAAVGPGGVAAGAAAGAGIGDGLFGRGTNVPEREKQRRELDQKLREARKRLGIAEPAGGDKGFTEQAQEDARNSLKSKADSFRSKLDEIDRAAQERTRQKAEEFRNRTRGGASGARDAADSAKSELDRLTEQARLAREAADKKRDEDASQLAGTDSVGNLGQQVVGSFSASALSAAGAGMGGVQGGIMQLTDLQKKEIQELVKQGKGQAEQRAILHTMLLEMRGGGKLGA